VAWRRNAGHALGYGRETSRAGLLPGAHGAGGLADEGGVTAGMSYPGETIPDAELLSGRPRFSSAGQQPVIRNGDLALTSTRLPGGGATVEVARRQPDGSWRWVIDQPAVLS
jgi:hypothetical protein